MKRTISLLFLLCAIAFVGCNNDNSNNSNPVTSAPTVLNVTPSSVSIGQKNGEGIITGTNLSGATLVALGDGVGVNSFAVHSANEIGFNYTVAGNITGAPKTVTVVTPGGTANNAGVFQVSNNHVPRPVVKIDPPTGSLATVISFDASSSNDPDNNIRGYKWDFGDGKIDQGKKVTHKYTSVGTYKATVRVTDSQEGWAEVTQNIEISRNSPPVARFTVEPGLSGTTSTTFVFDGSNSSDVDGKVKEYLWEFGDNNRIRGPKSVVEHVYKDDGTFEASLTVFDNSNQASAAATQKIKVEKGPREITCNGNGGGHQVIIKGRVVAVEPGQWAIVDFGAGHNCSNTWHKCDDFRRLDPEGFYGIVDKMTDRGNGILGVHNACPYRWPPSVGERVFIYFKTCSQNHCP